MFNHTEQLRPFRKAEILAKDVDFEDYLVQFDGIRKNGLSGLSFRKCLLVPSIL
jgi:hypothetical protein